MNTIINFNEYTYKYKNITTNKIIAIEYEIDVNKETISTANNSNIPNDFFPVLVIQNKNKPASCR